MHIMHSRRKFIALNSMAPAAFVNPVQGGLSAIAGNYGHGNGEPIEKLGGEPLTSIRDWYRSELLDRFVPNMDRYVVDHEYGGFMCAVEISSGELLSENKRTWYEGRGLWTYSFLYNNLFKDDGILEIASKSKEFIMRHQPRADLFWPSSFTRDGRILEEAGDDNPWISGTGDIYGNLFVAEGLSEYARATADPQCYEIAKKILIDSMAIYGNPTYSYPIDYLSIDAPLIKGVRVLGHWMALLRTTTQMLEYRPDRDIELINDQCLDAIMNHHLNPKYILLNEALNYDFSEPDNEFSQFAYVGHGIETLWMVMFEAIRRKDRKLFQRAGELFKRHVIIAHDTVYGGYFRSFDHVDSHSWKTDKVLWLQEEVLIGTLVLIAYTGDKWAQRCFADTFQYVREKFTKPGYKFWIHAADRKVEDFSGNRAEHYHHPRHLMLNLLMLDWFIENGGRTIDPFG